MDLDSRDKNVLVKTVFYSGSIATTGIAVLIERWATASAEELCLIAGASFIGVAIAWGMAIMTADDFEPAKSNDRDQPPNAP